MSESVYVRTMRTEDVPQVALLEKQIFSRPWSVDSFEKALTYPEQILLVAEETAGKKKAIHGYSILFAAADQADVSNIAVDPAFRGQKIGDALMREMLNRAKEKGVREVFLEVRESNAPAIGLYQQYGFSQIGVRKAYYEAPTEDALLMKMEFDQNEQ